MGDDGDNIFGIPSWGETTALKAIKNHQTYQNVLSNLHNTFDQYRLKYPDLKGDDFNKLLDIKTESKKQKYPEINSNLPFTGVALAVEDGSFKLPKDLKSGIKANLLALMFEDRVKLAYSLKKMDSNISDLPEITQEESNKEELVQYCDYYDMVSLKDDIVLLA
jgi:5'-3' exonuclease